MTSPHSDCCKAGLMYLKQRGVYVVICQKCMTSCAPEYGDESEPVLSEAEFKFQMADQDRKIEAIKEEGRREEREKCWTFVAKVIVGIVCFEVGILLGYYLL